MTRVLKLLGVIAVFGCLPLHAQESSPSPSSYVVIVSAHNPVTELRREFLAEVFLKKLTHWPHDGVIQPVDLPPASPVRREFSEEVLDRSVMGVKAYWQQLIFSGQNVPPPELANGREVIQYVSKNPDAIGYVSSKFASAAGVKTIGVK